MINELFKELKDLQIGLELEEGNLKVKAAKGVMTPELLQKVKANKAELIEFLQTYKQKKKDHEVIPALEASEGYELSSAQQRLWILSQFENERVAYNVPLSVRIAIKNSAHFIKAIEAVIDRHEILRTVFKADDNGAVKQWIHTREDLNFSVIEHDFSKRDTPIEAVKEHIKNDSYQPFDLTEGPLIRAFLLKLSEEEYVFYYNMHHIICDGWSSMVLGQEVQKFYEAIESGISLNLPPLRIQYKDYAAWQLNQFKATSFQNHKTYWLEKLSGGLPLLDLPTNLKRPSVKTNQGRSLQTWLPADLTKSLKTFCQGNEGTLFMGLLAGFNVLLYRYSGQEDLVVGTPVAGRDHQELENQIGFYINTLALRNQVDGTEGFASFFKRIKETVLKAYENQQYPFDQLINDLNLKRDTGRNAVYDVMLVLQNIGDLNQGISPEISQSNEILDLGTSLSQLDLNLDFQEVGDSIKMTVKYNPSVYEKELISQLMVDYKTLVGNLLANPSEKVGQVQLLSDSAVERQLVTLNQTAQDYPSDQSVVDLFIAQSKTTPNKVALVFEDQEWTYADLNTVSGQLANCLQKEHGIGKGAAIGIELERSDWQIISILGVLKAGAMYVPIASDYPTARKKHIVDSSNLDLLITVTDKMFDVDYYEGGLFAIDVEFTAENYEVYHVDLDANAPIYTMYTSGSTGKPKGVVVSHQNVVSLVQNTNFLDFNSDLTLLSTGAFSFDATTFEFWGMLLNGGTLVMCPQEVLLSAEKLEKTITEKGVNVMWFTSGWLNELVDSSLSLFGNLAIVLAGGDRLSPSHINQLRSTYPTLRIINGYGPTENTTFSLTHEIKSEIKGSVPIGKPLANKTVYILDEYQNLVPEGVVGELYLGGAGVALGYVNDLEQTNASFIPNPFNADERLYRSGDLGKWLPDGTVAFMGRKDVQVKIRGYRITLEEIEQELSEHADIENVVVLVQGETSGEKALVAYFTGSSDLVSTTLTSYLKTRLPSYMHPSAYVHMDAFPLTKNGKVDRKALAKTESESLKGASAYVAPETATEKTVVSIWEAVLEREKIGVADDFFELGGHSLKAMRLVNEYHKELGIRLSLKDLFVSTVLSAHVALLDTTSSTGFDSIEPIAAAESYAISDAQRRLWVLSQFEQGKSAYNMAFQMGLDESYDLIALKKSINAVVDRHEILRTIIDTDQSGEPRQWIKSREEIGFKIVEEDYSAMNNAETLAQEFIKADAQKGFDLTTGPLIRIALIKIANERTVLYYNLHHIISDAWSMKVVREDVMTFYNAYKDEVTPSLENLSIQYKDYSAWQLNQLVNGGFDEHRTYWANRLKNANPFIALPSSKVRPPIQTFSGQRIGTVLPKDISQKLLDFSNTNGGSLFMGIVATVKALCYRYTNQTNLSVGTPVAGREHSDLNEQIGFYVNTIVLNNELDPNASFSELFEQIKNSTLTAFEHQVYPFDRLVEELDIERDMSGNPLFNVMVALQNTEDGSDIQVAPSQIGKIIDYGQVISKFDLDFNFEEIGGHLAVQINFNRDIYDSELINSFLQHYLYLVENILQNPGKSIAESELLSSEEKKQVLELGTGEVVERIADADIVTLLEQSIESNSNQIALSCGTAEISYKELGEEINRLANFVQSKFNIEEGTVIAINMERSEKMIVSILAVLKLGAIYLPIDPSYPEQRKHLMMEDAKALFEINDSFYLDYSQNKQELSSIIKNDTVNELAYIIYTSGSTGKPKGVTISRKALLDYAITFSEYFELNKQDRIIQQAGLGFDTHIEEIFPALITGATVLVAKNGGADINEIQSLISEEKATVLSTTPLVLGELNTIGITSESLRLMISGGDKLEQGQVDQLVDSYQIYNSYGPSESTVCATYFEIEKNSPIRIGKPIANRTIYILDENQNLCPIGVVGEIYIGGKGVSKGYLNCSDLNEIAFVKIADYSDEFLFKTGDKARWLQDGSIDFIGRNDEQLKIRGYRVELGEIESVLNNYDQILSAAVVPTEDRNGLTAFVVCENQIDTEIIKSQLSKELPHYMIPSTWIALAEMPATVNGKIDRKVLNKKAKAALSQEIKQVEPITAQEILICELWANVLGVSTVGMMDDFFALGGNSLKLIRLIQQYHSEMGVKCELKDLFQKTTPEKHVLLIENGKKIEKDGLIPIEEKPYYSISDAQRRLWVLAQFEEAHTAYNMPFQLELESEIEVSIFIQAIHKVIERHEILRTVFIEAEEGQVYQKVLSLNEFNFQVEEKDYSNDTKAIEKSLQYIQEDRFIPFDLSNGPLIRAVVFNLGENRSMLYFNLHHIIADGKSMEVLQADVNAYYKAIKFNENVSLQPLKIQYKDYANWQLSMVEDENHLEDKKFWMEKLAGELPIVEFPTSKKRPSVKSYAAKSLAIYLNDTLSVELDSFVKVNEGTRFMGLLAATNALLFNYTGQTDIILGHAVEGREHPALENQIGFYVNTIIQRNKFSEKDSWKSLFEMVKKNAIESFQHQNYAFDRLVDDLNIQRDTSRNPVFDIMVTYQEQDGTIPPDTNYGVVYNQGTGIGKFDINLIFTRYANGLELSITYNTDCYEEYMMKQFLVHFETALQGMLSNENEALKNLEILTTSQTEKLLNDFTGVELAYDKLASVTAVFEKQVRETPEKTAIVYDKNRLSYAQLQQMVNEYAAGLKTEWNVISNQPIGIQLPISEKRIALQLAVLKLGAVFVPINEDTPEERKRFILEDCNCQILIGNEQLQVLENLKEKQEDIATLDFNSENHLAYIMYTSGSTGKPKGVKVTHQNITSLAKGGGFVELNSNRVLMATGSFAFDATTFEYWGMLLNGGTLVLSEQKVLADHVLLKEAIVENKVDIMWFTSGWLNQLVDLDLDLFASLKTIVAGGDKLSPTHISQLKNTYPHLEIINGYGPTENTTFSLTYSIDKELESIPLGQPLANRSVCILDAHDRLTPVGVAGEICLGGDGVAQGYVNDLELTNLKFTKHPLNASKRIYRSGDLGKCLPDGTVAFLGRKDDQVKIRGYRIDPEEIEYAIHEYEEVVNAVVVVNDFGKGEKEIAVYWTGIEIEGVEFRTRLLTVLPAYMIPTYYTFMAELPLNKNGKVNRKELPQPSLNTSEKQYVEPVSETEKKVVELWEKVLLTDKIGMQDDFFELGGHSLKAMRLIALYHQEFNVRLSLKSLFENTLASGHVELIEGAAKVTFAQINPVAVQDDYAISDAQRRLWVLSQFEEGSVAYNMPFSLYLEGANITEDLVQSIYAVVNRHEALRTTFYENKNGDLRQKIHSLKDLGFNVAVVDFRESDNAVKEVNDFIIADGLKPFDLENGPLVRVAILLSDDNGVTLYYNMHHIISDGWSMEVVAKDVSQYFEAYQSGVNPEIKPLQIQYKDYTQWQLDRLETEELKSQKAYWLELLKGTLPVLDLPFAKKRPQLKTFNGRTLGTNLSPELTSKMKQYAQQENGTTFITLLSALNALFRLYTSNDEFIVGAPVAGRNHSELEDQIGFYVNTLVLKNSVAKNDSFEAIFKRVKENVLLAYENQDYPFDKLVDELELKRNTSRSAVFDVMLVMQNIGENRSFEMGNEEDGIVDYGQKTGKFDLLLSFEENADSMAFFLEYNSDIFDQEFMESFIQHYKSLLDLMLENPNEKLEKLNYLSASETTRVISDFNSVENEFKSLSVVDMVENQANKTPDALALYFRDKSWSYEEINNWSNEIANQLITKYNIKNGGRVAVMLDRSEYSVVVMMAILKTGASYVPVDYQYPVSRIDFILNDAGVDLLITQKGLEEIPTVKIPETLFVDQKNEVVYSKDNPNVDIELDSESFVIYTSGSTGNPKGVMQTHLMLSNLIQWDLNGSHIGSGRKHLQYSSFSFDSSLHDILFAFSGGGSICLTPAEIRKDFRALESLILKEKIEVLSLPYAAVLNFFAQYDATRFSSHSLKSIISTGEQLMITDEIEDFLNNNPLVELHNHYGPSETHVVTGHWMSSDENNIEKRSPIGKVLPNTSIYILNEELNPVPVGVKGEMYIGGDNLALGYVGLEEQTKERFVQDPFKPDQLVYKSGDIGKWRTDGSIDYLGRNDDQVKIRGFRIELGEVETALMQNAQVEKAVVLVSELTLGEHELVAYLTLNDELIMGTFRAELALQLPDYMIPSRFIVINQFPMTSNGKVDKKALDPTIGQELSNQAEYVAPQNKIEEDLVTLWKTVLKKEKIGVNDNFFDLGGHSLTATRILSAINIEMGVQINIKNIFLNPTIRETAIQIDFLKKQKAGKENKKELKEISI